MDDIFDKCSFFFFKQKTAYEWRISDWSSDVCSSDLGSDDAEALVDRAIERFKADPAASELAGQRDLIARCFSASSVEAILAALDEAGSEERRVGKESVHTCRSLWSPYNSKKKSSDISTP